MNHESKAATGNSGNHRTTARNGNMMTISVPLLKLVGVKDADRVMRFHFVHAEALRAQCWEWMEPEKLRFRYASR